MKTYLAVFMVVLDADDFDTALQEAHQFEEKQEDFTQLYSLQPVRFPAENLSQQS